MIFMELLEQQTVKIERVLLTPTKYLLTTVLITSNKFVIGIIPAGI